MPVDEVLDQSYRTMKTLLDQGVGVQFVTKGAIPDRFFDLFAKRPELVAGQVGLTTLDARLNAAIETKAAPATRRLDDLARLIEVGVTASLRADPLIHRVTDDDQALNDLFTEAAKRSVRNVSASYLFLRPAIIGSLRRSIHDQALLRQILSPFKDTGRATFKTLGSVSGGNTLPTELRKNELDRIRRLAEQHGLALRICGCKNGDLTSNKCHLTNLSVTAKAMKQAPATPKLF